MVLERTLRCVCYVALLLMMSVVPRARAEEFLSCASPHPSPQKQYLEYTGSRAKEIFSRLMQVEAFLHDSEKPHIAIEASAVPNAFVRNSAEVVITTSALELLDNRSELAFILAHELSHIALGHQRPGSVDNELQADRLALSLVRRAGFDTCASSIVLARLGSPYAASLDGLTPRLEALRTSQDASCNGGLPLLTPHQHYTPGSANSLTVAHQSSPNAQLASLKLDQSTADYL
jgi:hypothetical protein